MGMGVFDGGLISQNAQDCCVPGPQFSLPMVYNPFLDLWLWVPANFHTISPNPPPGKGRGAGSFFVQIS